MTKVTIQCRSTGRGAYTSVTEYDEAITVTKVNISKTGNHWEEIVEGPSGAEFLLTDITNSGKDQSTRYCLTDSGMKIV